MKIIFCEKDASLQKSVQNTDKKSIQFLISQITYRIKIVF
jgi:hypothetical protein